MGNCLHRMFWKVSWQFKHIQCLIFIVCLTGFPLQTVAMGSEAKLQRRFMWKQMDVENLMSGMANGARVMRHMLSELVPTKQTSTMSGNMLDYLPSETTRVKYIIHSPASKRPVKIIKMRPSKKIIKIKATSQLTHNRENKPAFSHKPQQQQHFLSSEEMHKLEKEQEMIAEGRSPPKPEAELLDEVKQEKALDDALNAPKNNNEIINGKTAENNGWLPVYDVQKSPKTISYSKPSVLSPLHTNIMAEPLPKPEKLISPVSETSKDEIAAESKDASHFHHYYNAPRDNHGYEVTEYIAEESMPLPQTQSARINVRAGVASSKYFSYTLPQASTPIKTKSAAVIKPAATTTTEEPPNYPESFLRSFQERTASTAASSPVSAARARFRASPTETNNGWAMMMPKASYKTTAERATSRTKLQHASATSMRTKSKKWPAELTASIPSSMPSQLAPHSTGLAAANMPTGSMRQLAAGPPTTTATKQLALATSNGRLRKTLTSISTAPSPEQSGEAPKSRNIRHRGTVKFGDKTFEDI